MDALIAEHRGTSPLASRWNRANELVTSIGILPHHPAFAEMFALALEGLSDDGDNDEAWISGFRQGQTDALWKRRAELAGKAIPVPDGHDMLAFQAGYKAAIDDFAPPSKMNGAYTFTLGMYATDGIRPSVPGQPEPPLAEVKAMLDRELSGNTFSAESTPVEVGGWRYGFDEDGAYRDSLTHDGLRERGFFRPVAEMMQARGMTAESVRVTVVDDALIDYFDANSGCLFSYDSITTDWFVTNAGEPLFALKGIGKDKAPPSFSSVGIPTSSKCSRCEKGLESDRTAVCKSCEPDDPALD